MWKTVNYEACGRGHIKTGTPCQDKTLSITKNGVQIISLADGAGSAKFSHFGAETAIKSVSHFVCDSFDTLISTADGYKVKEEIHNRVRIALEAEMQRLSCEYKDLASTLLLVAIKEKHFLIVHVGDGVIGYIKNGDLLVASNPDNGEFANATVFLTSNNVTASMKLIKGEIDDISGFVLMSDGTAESFYHKKTKILASAIKKIVNWTALLNSEKMLSLISDSFNEIVIKNTQDDCSIAVIALSSNKRDEYFNMSLIEKVDLLGMNSIYSQNIKKRISRYDEIIVFLKEPRTLKQVSRYIHLKPKYTKKYLEKLVEKGMIFKENCFYHI